MKKITAVDVIIISYAQTEDLKTTTKECVKSLIKSEDSGIIKFTVLIIESEKSIKPYQYPNTTTVYPDEEFGYHKYLNIGIKLTTSPYVCLLNNDLLFHNKWMSNIVDLFNKHSEIFSASPICSFNAKSMGYNINSGIYHGYGVGKEIAGWCIIVKRELFQLSGILDENYKFWYSDNDYANTLYVLGVGHVLITSSVVDHLSHSTIKKQDEKTKLLLTVKEFEYYKKKWMPRLGINWIQTSENDENIFKQKVKQV